MKKVTFIIVLLSIGLMYIGCAKDSYLEQETVLPAQDQLIMEEEPIDENVNDDNTFIVKMDNTRNMYSILQEILSNGTLIDKDIYAKRFGEYEYTWEMWVIKEDTGDFHVAIIENGILIDISPANDLEDAKIKFKPYGGWRDKK